MSPEYLPASMTLESHVLSGASPYVGRTGELLLSYFLKMYFFKSVFLLSH